MNGKMGAVTLSIRADILKLYCIIPVTLSEMPGFIVRVNGTIRSNIQALLVKQVPKFLEIL